VVKIVVKADLALSDVVPDGQDSAYLSRLRK
jgi:hypothetical protein